MSGYTTNGSATATSGSSGQGGHGGARDITRSGRRSWFSAGGAGGGYYGGGGGDIWLVPGLNSGYEDVLGGDSGGGSNYVGGVTSTTSTRGVRTGHGQVTITYTLPPAVPTGVEVVSAIPSAAGEVREPRPTLRADIPAHPDDAGGLTHQLEFQVSRNSGFSDLVGTYTTAMVDATAEDNDQDAAVGVDLDNNTTFWVRARSKDSRGNASAWTAGISFEVIYENSWGGGFI